MRGVYKAFPCFVSPHPNPLQQEMERELALLNLMAVTLCAGMQPETFYAPHRWSCTHTGAWGAIQWNTQSRR